jgi:hypothetical protein
VDLMVVTECVSDVRDTGVRGKKRTPSGRSICTRMPSSAMTCRVRMSARWRPGAGGRARAYLDGVAALLGVFVDVQDSEALDKLHQAPLPLLRVAVDQQIARPGDEVSFLVVYACVCVCETSLKPYARGRGP